MHPEVQDGGDTEPFMPVQVKVYKRRWWILFLFAGLGFMQCAVWNTWGPITGSMKFAYHSWDDAEIGLLSMWGTLTMIVGLIPFTIMLQTKGLRVSMIVTSALIAAGSSIRIFAQGEASFTVLANIGSILNGFGGIIIGSAPSLISSTWFPPHERTTATAVGCTFNQLGNAGGFFLGPLIVKEPDGNGTSPYSPDDIAIETMRRNIRDYMWITAGLCVPFLVFVLAYFPAAGLCVPFLVFVLAYFPAAGLCVPFLVFVLAYFPDKPKRPPSLTSAMQESSNDLKGDVKLLLRNRNFWLLMIPYGLTIGINVAWSSVVDINVAPMGIKQDDASLLGVYMTFGGVLLALLVSRFTDLLFGYIKVTIIVLLFVATLGFLWFLFLMNGCLPYDKTQVIVSAVVGASFSYAASPLFFELAVEIAYPVPEGIVGGFLTLFWNLMAAMFLGLLQLKMESVLWMDYVLAAQSILSLVFMIFLKEEYKRTALDKVPNTTVQAEDDDEQPLLAELFLTI